jgi:hypothetical protein
MSPWGSTRCWRSALAGVPASYYKVPSLRGVWYRGPFEHNSSVATLEDWFDPRRLRPEYEPTGWKGPPGTKTHAVPGHRFGLNLPPDDRRDLKPGNVVIAALGGQRDVAKLLDFGLVHDLSAADDDRLTRTGTVLGTPAYMSPEQAAGESVVDARGDVYSLGAVAFFALTGRPPFQGKTFGQILAAHRSESRPPLADVRPDAPADLAAAVARCLARNPGDRFQSVVDLDRALGQCCCASDWSTERAAEWWAGRAACDVPTSPIGPSRTFG